MSFKPEVKVQGNWYRNSLVFETMEEAEANAHDLHMRWMSTEDSRAVESDEPATHLWQHGQLYSITHKPEVKDSE